MSSTELFVIISGFLIAVGTVWLVAHKRLASERKRSAALDAKISEYEAKINELEAASLDALGEDVTVLLGALGQAATLSQNFREVVATLLEEKGLLHDVKKRCSDYTQRLNAVDQKLPALTAMLQQWSQWIRAMQQQPSALDALSAAADGVFANIDSLTDDMREERYKELLEEARTRSIKEERDRWRKMREKLAEVGRRIEERRLRNPKAAAAALPQPNARANTVPKGIVRSSRIPPSSR